VIAVLAESKDTKQPTVGKEKANQMARRRPILLVITAQESATGRCNVVKHITADCPDKNIETGLLMAFNVEEEPMPEQGFKACKQPDPEWVCVVKEGSRTARPRKALTGMITSGDGSM
jgi:hypothetical protein